MGMTTATTMTAASFRVLGMTDDGACECCGRTDLKRRVVLLRLSSDERVMFGTACAARALQTSSKHVTRAAADAQCLADRDAKVQARAAAQASERAARRDQLLQMSREDFGRPQ
jgi:hypothetical protein